MITTLTAEDCLHELNQDEVNIEPDFYSEGTTEVDVTSVHFSDQGELENKEALAEILQHIQERREDKKNTNGVIVTVFVHGWHHCGDWNDTNYQSFRYLLASLCYREVERYKDGLSKARRIIGIYIGWKGDPNKVIKNIPLATHLTFGNRYKVAETIGKGNDLHQVVSSLIHSTKSPLMENDQYIVDQALSPLILTGHSMGGLIIEKAFLEVLKRSTSFIEDKRPPEQKRIVDLRKKNIAILAPDLILAINSAADAEVATKIKHEYEQQQWKKVATSSDDLISYHPPMLICVTSEGDKATRIIWRFGKLSFTKKTAAHTEHLVTHTFNENGSTTCSQKPGPDFNQAWHCLREPSPPLSKSPYLAIDLPKGARVLNKKLEHVRYSLDPIDTNNEALAWIFRIPKDISFDHNDIFNSQMGALLLALIQVSGAVMSLAQDWDGSFEGNNDF